MSRVDADEAQRTLALLDALGDARDERDGAARSR